MQKCYQNHLVIECWKCSYFLFFFVPSHYKNRFVSRHVFYIYFLECIYFHSTCSNCSFLVHPCLYVSFEYSLLAAPNVEMPRVVFVPTRKTGEFSMQMNIISIYYSQMNTYMIIFYHVHIYNEYILIYCMFLCVCVWRCVAVWLCGV